MMNTMRGIQVHAYGDSDQLQFEEIPLPEPQAGEVLVRVQAAGVNALDWKIRSGAMQQIMPVTFPYVPGVEIVGIVERVGAGVTSFQPGQAVFGRTSSGAYAEYTVAPAESLALKPESLSFEEAAAVPIGALTAWQGLFDHGQLQAGQRVLILGGAGGVGTFAIQFAHRHGAHVITTTSTSNVEFVRSLGADTVIDYTQTSLADAVHDVDLVFDAVGGAAAISAFATLKRGGRFISIVMPPDAERAEAAGVSASFFPMQFSAELLSSVAQMIDAGELRTFTAAVFPLHEADKAHELSQRGHGRGRIILQMA